LLLPSEVVDGANIVLEEVINDITGMDVSCDQGHNDLSLQGCEFASDELSKLT
jgi:hypothetical protein